jgi:hypothetical protein
MGAHGTLRRRMPTRPRLARAALLASAAALAGGCGLPAAVAGYGAKMLCSCTFVAGRDAATCLDEELGSYGPILSTEVDREHRTVRARGLYWTTLEAVYDDELGCTLR